MRPIEESVVIAMDGKDKHLYPYLPYILQDIWELGASPEIIINLIKMHKSDFENIKILDLGSGKGVVSIKIAKELKCHCFGIETETSLHSPRQGKSCGVHLQGVSLAGGHRGDNANCQTGPTAEIVSAPAKPREI